MVSLSASLWLFLNQPQRRREIDISNFDKAVVLAALYNRAQCPGGMAALQYDPKPMTVAEALQLLDGGSTYFDYLNGRVMKVDLGESYLDTRFYDRDNGPGAAEAAILEAVTRPAGQGAARF